MDAFLGIDVGTGSARAGLFDRAGTMLASAAFPIRIFEPRDDFREHSSADIWQSVCKATRKALAEAGLRPGDVKGIGFDATCSLVAVGGDGEPVSVSPTGKDEHDIIVWMDHRAIGEASDIDATNDPILRFTGGTISPEMEMPKLLWLKRNFPEAFARAKHVFDLPDWLVHRATGTMTRSLCSVTCKWTYQGSRGLAGEGWDHDFLTRIGLGELLDDNHARIGNRFAAPGDKVGELSTAAAEELGLAAGTPVAASLIDAYSGALGTLGIGASGRPLGGRLALIAGTSACHIAVAPEACFVPGVWGPYLSVLVPGLWANEAGQSAAGALLDRVIAGHAASAGLSQKAKEAGRSIHALMDDELLAAAGNADDTHRLTAGYHVQPDFHGNRSPLADPTRHGGVSGLSMASGAKDLAIQYLAALQALAYGTRHIVESLRASGVPIDTLVVSGGLARNALYLREHADATGCTILVPDQAEPVLLGSAMLGAVVAGATPSLEAAMAAMSGKGATIHPRGGAIAAYHDAKYTVFRRMQDDFAAYRDIMKDHGGHR